ncbi:CDP-diacylglycerol--glycerol-3-phosphate 3-phosphatidyltransferase [hydrothermal vent metagenome]|uniref:CDP-diacylglycerol--glycerol-3-phosphate 3-phosphatidyltransferase n=1 Tax=hydrothermal vent metagenome TaxID=652676 RepID=A0A3B0VMF1_9ZZZZ
MTTYYKYIPNMITIARMVALLPLVWLMWHKEYKSALLVAVIAGASDGLDGFLAKKYNWQGWLGGILDPLADKLMMLCGYSVFVLQGVIPLWLYLMVVIRDVIIVAGASYYHFRIGKIEQAQPSLISKTNTALQILLLLVLLISLSGWWNLNTFHWPLMLAVAVFTGLSGLHYIWLGFSMANRVKSKQRKELGNDQ